MPHHKENTKILIVGAGPAGLMMACQLSLFGIPFRIIDKKSAPANYSGALIVHAKTLELLQQLGLAEKALTNGTKINTLSVLFNGNKTYRLDVKHIGKNLSQFPSMLMLEQSKTELLLIEFLKEKGVEVEWQTKLVDLKQTTGKVSAFLQIHDGSDKSVNASYLIAADGGESTVRALLNIPFHGKTHKEKLCIVECKSDIPLTDNEVCFSFSKHATAGFFPLPANRWRIDAALKNVQNSDSPLTFEGIQKNFGQTTKTKVNIHDHDFFSVFHSHGKYVEKFQERRCFLIGDAAHLFTPVGAQGMNTGLQDAQNLAWKLALVLQKKIKPAVLKTYELERKPLAKKVSKNTSLFFKVVASDAWFFRAFRMNGLKYFLRLIVIFMKKRSFRNYVFKNISGTGISYKKNFLITSSESDFGRKFPKPGHRFPFFQYEIDGIKQDIREQVKPTAFHLLIFPKGRDADSLLKATVMFRQIISIQQIPYSAETEELYDKMGISSGGWYLVRPDFHITCRSSNLSAAPLKSYLNKIMLRNVEKNK